ncbi:PD-(D/E)XK nuclease family protein [Halobacterium jilantaiense]|uniref:Putative RecB family exonuclease n=1 Tax=Halobacterium jilantaiense TaxID=355548 RepID=A0A1I0NJB5_9EURY|nr:PD-(D/E)XK nuclease family protein [Halobacterium jilantaiense]SEW01337.1 putative RecB family exonuclease [Halobacterium jilantaiense]
MSSSLSPSRLATYATCPRQYDYGYVQDVNTPDRTELYLNQGTIYHETIEDVCDETDRDDAPETIHERAMRVFDAKWAEHSTAEDYESDAHQAYQRAENRAGIAAFFDPDGGDGIEHARRSVATEVWVECECDGVRLHGKADNVVRTDEGLHIFDYKRNVRGVLTPWTAQYLADHRDGDAHEPKRVRNAFQTATYVEGVKNEAFYEADMEVRFSFYGLLHDTDFTSTPDGYEVSASGKERETTELYEEHYDTIWALIREAHDGITSERYEPAFFELITEEACPDCDYREMCADRLSTEVQR